MKLTFKSLAEVEKALCVVDEIVLNGSVDLKEPIVYTTFKCLNLPNDVKAIDDYSIVARYLTAAIMRFMAENGTALKRQGAGKYHV
jgi:hypothetical protein